MMGLGERPASFLYSPPRELITLLIIQEAAGPQTIKIILESASRYRFHRCESAATNPDFLTASHGNSSKKRTIRFWLSGEYLHRSALCDMPEKYQLKTEKIPM
jgi:hypothetical protein